MKRALLPLGVSVSIVLIDQISKILVASYATMYEVKTLIPYVLEFYYLHNYGGAMGLFDGARIPLVIITTGMIVVCLWYLLSGRCQSGILRYAFALIIGGGIGNLIDRLVYGYVVDFIRFPVSWFSYSFNIADCAVCIGAGLLILDLIMDTVHHRRKKAGQ